MIIKKNQIEYKNEPEKPNLWARKAKFMSQKSQINDPEKPN